MKKQGCAKCDMGMHDHKDDPDMTAADEMAIHHLSQQLVRDAQVWGAQYPHLALDYIDINIPNYGALVRISIDNPIRKMER